MADRDKVIKELEEVQHYICVENLPAHTLKAKLVIDDAIALLKAQEAVEPSWRRGIPFCGKCGRQFGRGFKYCPDCGQAVKWE